MYIVYSPFELDGVFTWDVSASWALETYDAFLWEPTESIWLVPGFDGETDHE